jgi:tetratricopeptide (TPR) repeat protein
MGRHNGWLRGAALAGIALLVGLVVAGLGVWRRLETDPARVFLRADSLLKAGRYAEADAACDQLARLQAPTAVDRFLRAEVKIGLGRLDAALSELALVPDDHPIAPLARLRTGQVEMRLGRPRRAESAFLASLRLLPRGVQPRKELVYIYNIQHRQTELDAQLASLLDLDALDFQTILHWTKTRHTVWNPAGDLAALEKFVAADPADRWSRLALAEAFLRLDQLDRAEAVLAVLPADDPDARAKRVRLLMGRGDFASAESLLAGGPLDHPELARLRGQLALRRREGAAAAHHFRIALDADAFDHRTLSGLGTALRMLGRSKQARPYLEAARRHEDVWALVARAATAEGERDPKMPRQLGLACAAIGRVYEARAWLKLAIKADPLDDASQQALFDLEHGTHSRSSGESGRPASAALGDGLGGVNFCARPPRLAV